MTQLDLLYRLQQIDDEIRQKKKRLGEVIQALKESDALLRAREAAATAAAELQKWQTRQRALNLELNTLNDKVKRSEDRLYSGKVKNPKELTDLQKEIEALGRRRTLLEDDILEAMIALEDAQVEESARSEALARAEVEHQRTQINLQQEQAVLARRINELNALRQQQLPFITPASLAEYEEVARRKGGLVVVGLKDNRCLGCQLTVSSAKVQAAGEGLLVNCGNCGRILNPI